MILNLYLLSIPDGLRRKHLNGPNDKWVVGGYHEKIVHNPILVC